jgi:hypothetical protein
MTAPPTLLAYVTKLPGRCKECGWHMQKQGHSATCSVGKQAIAERRPGWWWIGVDV